MDRQTLNKMARSLMDINSVLQPIADRYLAEKQEERDVHAFMQKHRACIEKMKKKGAL